MLGTTHVIFAVFLFMVLWRCGFVGVDLLFFAGVVVGSVLPDIDHPRGLLYHFLGFPRWVRRGVVRAVGQRGVVHSLLAALIVLVLGLLVGLLVGVGFGVGFGLFVGFLSHLVLDSLTVRGVGWLLPFSKRRVRFVVGTGTMVERLFFFALVVLVVVLGFPLVSEVVGVFVWGWEAWMLCGKAGVVSGEIIHVLQAFFWLVRLHAIIVVIPFKEYSIVCVGLCVGCVVGFCLCAHRRRSSIVVKWAAECFVIL